MLLICLLTGEKLSVCGRGMTCCTPAMEAKLNDISDKQFQTILQESTGSLLGNFTSRARKFDGKFSVSFHFGQFGNAVAPKLVI